MGGVFCKGTKEAIDSVEIGNGLLMRDVFEGILELILE